MAKKDDLSKLPPERQAAIKASQEASEKKEKKARPSDSGPNPTLPQQARDAIDSAAASAHAEAPEPEIYVVKSGDSLSKIAKEKLGDASRWPEIFDLNKDQIEDPNLIHVGQELRLPS